MQYYTARVNFNHDSPKINFKIYLLLQYFLDKCLKLGSLYVLGTETKLLIEPIFDSKSELLVNFSQQAATRVSTYQAFI